MSKQFVARASVYRHKFRPVDGQTGSNPQVLINAVIVKWNQAKPLVRLADLPGARQIFQSLMK